MSFDHLLGSPSRLRSLGPDWTILDESEGPAWGILPMILSMERISARYDSNTASFWGPALGPREEVSRIWRMVEITWDLVNFLSLYCSTVFLSSTMQEGNSSFEGVVMPMFGSEPWFKPEPTRTGPRFGPKFKEIIEPNPRSGSTFREWTMALNTSKPGSNRTFLGQGGQSLSYNFIWNDKMSASINPEGRNGAFVCTVSMMARTLRAFKVEDIHIPPTSRVVTLSWLMPSKLGTTASKTQ